MISTALPIGASGLRSSCDSIARNSSLRLLAISSSASVRRRSVISSCRLRYSCAAANAIAARVATSSSTAAPSGVGSPRQHEHAQQSLAVAQRIGQRRCGIAQRQARLQRLLHTLGLGTRQLAAVVLGGGDVAARASWRRTAPAAARRPVPPWPPAPAPAPPCDTSVLRAAAHVEQAAQRMAQLGQEGRAAGRLFGHQQRRLGGGLRDARIGLPRDATLQQLQLDEHPHLGAQHLGHHRRQDVVDRAQRIAARGLHLVGVGGDEDDRRVRRALVAADQRGRLEAVDVGHVDVEQDHRELARQHLAQRLGARADEDQVLLQLLEHGPEDQQLLLQVVDHQDVDLLRLRRQQRAAGRARQVACGAQWHSQPLQHRQQVHRIDRLGQVVPGAGLDALLAVALHGLGGDRHQRQVAAARQLADLLHRRHAVHLGHHDVHQHDVDRRVGFDQRGSPRGRCRPRRSPCRPRRARWPARRCCACRRRRSAPSCPCRPVRAFERGLEVAAIALRHAAGLRCSQNATWRAAPRASGLRAARSCRARGPRRRARAGRAARYSTTGSWHTCCRSAIGVEHVFGAEVGQRIVDHHAVGIAQQRARLRGVVGHHRRRPRRRGFEQLRCAAATRASPAPAA